MKYLFLDFETCSGVNLRKIGAINYASHATTRVHCMAYAELTGDAQLWLPGHKLPAAFDSPLDWMWVAHNVQFEWAILKYIFDLDIPPKNWTDTAAIARHHSLPGSLEGFGEFMGVPKDMDGHRIMMKLARPRSNGEFWTPQNKSEDFEKLYLYCQSDIEVSRNGLKRFGRLPKKERIQFELSLKINDNGLKIDVDSIYKMQRLLEKERAHYQKKIRALTGGIGENQTAKLAEFCGMPSVDKEHVRDALKRSDLPRQVRTALECRKILSSTSVKKLNSILNRICDDLRVHDGLIYAGASRTSRYSGSGIQPHNFPRGCGDKTYRYFTFKDLPKPWHDTIRDMLKGLITGPFCIADFSQIEARCLVWKAEQFDQLAMFADPNIDPYKNMAAKIYGLSVEDINTEMRFLGKQAVLGAGFGVGVVGFDYMLRSKYDVELPIPLIEKTVQTYRRLNPKVVEFWRGTDRAFRSAMRGDGVRYLGLEFRPIEDGVTITLPSGRKLYYYRAQIIGRNILVYGKIKSSNKYGLIKTYGSKLVENIIQAIARDIMCEAMVRLDRAGFPINLTVHDEIIAESLANSLSNFVRIVKQVPVWAKGLPIAVEAFHSQRYRK